VIVALLAAALLVGTILGTWLQLAFNRAQVRHAVTAWRATLINPKDDQ
jgi:hypothetical protein